MAWIESHQELGRHPKTRKLAKLLDISRPAVVGHLQYLWWWALDFAQDGDISRFEDEEIAEACLWDGDAGRFVSAMSEAGFLDLRDCPGGSERHIHDWEEYAGRLIQQRRQNANKQKQWREKHRNDEESKPAQLRNRNVTVTSPSALPLRNGATVPNSTEQYRTVPKSVEVTETLGFAPAAPAVVPAGAPISAESASDANAQAIQTATTADETPPEPAEPEAKKPRGPALTHDNPVLVAVMAACEIDRGFALGKSVLNATGIAKRFLASGQAKNLSPPQMADRIAQCRTAWDAHHWKGRKGEPPTPGELLEEYPRLMGKKDRPEDQNGLTQQHSGTRRSYNGQGDQRSQRDAELLAGRDRDRADAVALGLVPESRPQRR